MPNAFHYSNTFDDTLAAQFKGILSHGFDPRQLEDLLLWLDAKDISTIIKDGSNKVSKWADKSGRNNHAIQANEIRQATYSSNGLDGKPTLIFNNQHFVTPSNTIGDLTVFAVFTNDNTFPVGGGDVDFIMSHAGFNVSTANGYVNTPAPAFRQEGMGASSYYLNGQLQAGNNTPISTGNAYIGGITAANGVDTSIIGIGGHYNDSGFGDYKGKISEIILFNRQLTNAQRQLVEAYLSAKWAITLQS
jgi:hypothetical protein